jgi:hypothetical protein
LRTILHVFSAHTASHIREITRENSKVFSDFRNEAIAVRTKPAGFSSSVFEEAAAHALLLNWWETPAFLLSEKYHRVILHGGYWPKIWRLLFFAQLVRRNQIFVSWGGEISRYPGIKDRIAFWLQSKVLCRARAVVFLSNSDAEKAREISSHLNNAVIIPYFNSSYMSFLGNQNLNPHSIPTLQVGNDAREDNNHIACLTKIADSGLTCNVVIPFSYGRLDENYINEVKEYAKKIKNARVCFFEELLPKEDFDKLIASCDGLLIGSKNQRALYSIYSYLTGGKPVFVPGDSDIQADLHSVGFQTHRLEAYSEVSKDRETFCLFNRHNAAVALEFLSLEGIRREWLRII